MQDKKYRVYFAILTRGKLNSFAFLSGSLVLRFFRYVTLLNFVGDEKIGAKKNFEEK